jgi:lactoylglutathione lyase
MEIRSIDHLNLRIPADGAETAVAFYRDRLGLATEGLDRHRRGDRSFFDVRLAPAHVLHLWPTSAFEPPTGDGYDHVAPVVDADIDPVERDLAAAVAVDSRLDAPLGATGRAPAVYVTDPFGYRIELKAGRE